MATFQVSEKTRAILKNFAGISNSIIIAPGKTQRTIAKGKSVLALAEFPDAWPVETPIYDLNKFLATLSALQAPVIEFTADRMKMTDGRTRHQFRYSDPSTIMATTSKTLATANPKVSFQLTEKDLDRLSKLAAIHGADQISVIVENGAVTLSAADSKNPAANESSVDIAPEDVTAASSSWSHTVTFSTEHIAMLLTGAYTVSVSDWNYGYFQHKTEPVAYFIVAQV